MRKNSVVVVSYLNFFSFFSSNKENFACYQGQNIEKTTPSTPPPLKNIILKRMPKNRLNLVIIKRILIYSAIISVKLLSIRIDQV